MASTLLTILCIALIIFVLLILIRRKSIFNYPKILALFFAVFFIDNLLIVLSNRFSWLQIVPNTIWEGSLVCGWSGKIYSLVCILILFVLFRKILGKAEVGLTVRQYHGSVLPASLVILILASWALLVGVSSPEGKFDLSTLTYLAIMPGLNEELVYRGVLLAILVKIFPENFKLLGAPFGWGIIVSSLLFGLLHGFWFDRGLAIHIEVIALRNATVSGLIFAWLKMRTGSLVMPVIAHSLEDFLFFLPRMV
jgi:uncharacterized protein